MSSRLAVIGSILTVALLAAATASAKEPHRARGPVAVPAAEPPGERLPLPEPPTAVTERHPHTSHARILRVADGRLALAIARDDGLSVVALDADGVPARETWVTNPRLGWPFDILPTRDGGFFVYLAARGPHLRSDGGSAKVWRFDGNWHDLWSAWIWSDWTRQFDTTAAGELPDGGFLVVGESREEDPDPFIDRAVRFDAGGHRLWERDIAPPRKYYGWFSVVPAADGGAIISVSRSFYRIDGTGRRLWRRRSPGLFRVYPSSPGSFILAGPSDNAHQPDKTNIPRFLIMRYNSTGRELWRRRGIGRGPRSLWIRDELFPHPDGGIIHYTLRRLRRIEGSSDDHCTWTEHALARFDAAGTLRWVRNLRADDDGPCDSPRRHVVRDINVLPNGRMLLLWCATDDMLDEEKTTQWWLTSMPFD